MLGSRRRYGTLPLPEQAANWPPAAWQGHPVRAALPTVFVFFANLTMSLIRAGILFAVPTFLKLLAGLLVVKLVAHYLGAEGLGKLGQFMSLMTMATIVACGGISNGIVKYVAEFKDIPERLKAYVQVASMIAVVSSIILFVVLFVLSHEISTFLFRSPDYAFQVRILSVVQFAIAAGTFLLGILNGLRDIKFFAIVNVASVAFGICGVYFSTRHFGFVGAMYGLMWLPACQLLFLAVWYLKVFRRPLSFVRPLWNGQITLDFMRFSLMQLTSVLTVQMAQVVIRNMLEARTNWVEVGYWQGLSRFSDAYLQFITIVLANYVMPKLSSLRKRHEVIREVASVYKIIVPILIAMMPVIVLLRDLIIRTLFSASFLPMRDYFIWQVGGDFFKVIAYVAGYVAVAKAATRLYIALEIVQAGLLVMLCMLLVTPLGLKGVVIAYFFNYLFYAVLCTFGLYVYAKRS
jgi:antigen flippase